MCATGKDHLGKTLPYSYKALLKRAKREHSYCPNMIQLQETSCHYTSGKLWSGDSKGAQGTYIQSLLHIALNASHTVQIHTIPVWRSCRCVSPPGM